MQAFSETGFRLFRRQVVPVPRAIHPGRARARAAAAQLPQGDAVAMRDLAAWAAADAPLVDTPVEPVIARGGTVRGERARHAYVTVPAPSSSQACSRARCEEIARLPRRSSIITQGEIEPA